MADIRYDVGVITEVIAGEEGDEFSGEHSKPNKIVLQVPKFKWPLTIGFFGNDDLVEPLQELSMAGVKVKATYLHTDPVGSGDDARRYRNLIKVETEKGQVIEVPDAAEAAEAGTWGSNQGGGQGTASSVTVIGTTDESLRIMAVNAAAVMLAAGGALKGKWDIDLAMVESHARELLTLVGADPKVAEGFVETAFAEDPAF